MNVTDTLIKPCLCLGRCTAHRPCVYPDWWNIEGPLRQERRNFQSIREGSFVLPDACT